MQAFGKRYDCGKEATSALRVKIGKASITCKGDKRDQYDRLIAVCYLDDMDLNGFGGKVKSGRPSWWPTLGATLTFWQPGIRRSAVSHYVTDEG